MAVIFAHHLSYNIPVDSAYTFFKYNSAVPGVYFDWWADTADFRFAQFAIGCNKDSSGDNLGRTAYLNAITDF